VLRVGTSDGMGAIVAGILCCVWGQVMEWER
jgi:hypothetical protein